MRIRKIAPSVKKGLDLAEEVVHLLRRAPLSLLAAYLVGVIPFFLGFLYFIADMDRSPFAAQRLGEEALGMVALFIWMKSWQTVFASGMRHLLRGEAAPPWTLRRVGRVVFDQAIIQSTAVLVVPVAIFFVFPLPWVYAAYQNFTVLGDGSGDSQRSLVNKSIRMALLWHRQNLMLVWLLSPWMLFTAVAMLLLTIKSISAFGMVILFPLIPLSLMMSPVGSIVTINMGLLVALTPMLLHKFLGIETMFMRSGLSAVFNSTFLATILGLSYICLDPVIKAVYASRCFYGDALTTGDDLRAELRRHANHGGKMAAFALVAIFLAFASQVFAADPAKPAGIAPRDLNDSINRVLEEPQYSWRQPHAKPAPAEAQKGWFATFLNSAADLGMKILHWLQQKIKDLIEWVLDHLPKREHASSEHGKGWSMEGVNLLLYILLAVSVLALVFIIMIHLRQLPKGKKVKALEIPAAMPDVEDENVTADRLPTDEWITLAQSLIEKGELRLALRALFLANLAWLGQKELIRIARFKSNRDYLRELAIRAHVYPDLPPKFSDSMRIFERVWYGRYEADAELIRIFNANSEGMRTCAE